MVPGVPDLVSPTVRRLLAPNPGILTGPGTNSYLVGSDQLAVVDPGPDLPSHLDAVARWGKGRVRWILVTHAHPDHCLGAAGLRERTGAEVLGWGAGQRFRPDGLLGDGDVVDGPGFRLRALHTPGHASDHLCFLLESEGLLFSGDHVLAGTTVVVAPPDGDMADYLDSLRRLKGLGIRAMAPGHGPLVEDPEGRIDEYLAHRRAREAAVLDALAMAGRATVAQLVGAVYGDVRPELHPAAALSLWAHLRKLAGDGRARSPDPDAMGAWWEATPPAGADG